MFHMTTSPTFPTYDTVDLFAGPGGWSVAAQRLGLREIGIEYDKAAHMTRRAAGFATIRDDVRRWGPANFPNATGLIASPPCQTFSMAGKGAGRAALDNVLQAIHAMRVAHENGMPLADWLQISDQEHLLDWSDERTSLVLEPLRWALEAAEQGRPFRWLAFEQVPTVLPVWVGMSEALRAVGYSVAVGKLSSEQYGVPQTRERAILVARLDGDAELPTPTHSRFHKRDKGRLDDGVLPWVSMAQALGWGATQRPSMTVTGGGTGSGGAEPFGNAARQGLQREQREGRWQLATGTRARATQRLLDEPSPALAFGNDAASHVWAPAGMTPAEIVDWKKGHPDWTFERPATTVVGSFSPETIAALGYRVSAADGSRQNAPRQCARHSHRSRRAAVVPRRLPVAGNEDEDPPTDRERDPAALGGSRALLSARPPYQGSAGGSRLIVRGLLSAGNFSAVARDPRSARASRYRNSWPVDRFA